METTKATNGLADVTARLKKEAGSSKAFSDACTIFALRERARAQVTLSTLKANMISAGFKYTAKDLEHILQVLAKLGLGKLHKDTKGRIRGLIDVKYTLQSIGLAAVGENLKLAPFEPQRRFSTLPLTSKTVSEIREAAAKTAVARGHLSLVRGEINGQLIDIPLTPEQFQSFLADLLGKSVKK